MLSVLLAVPRAACRLTTCCSWGHGAKPGKPFPPSHAYPRASWLHGTTASRAPRSCALSTAPSHLQGAHTSTRLSMQAAGSTSPRRGNKEAWSRPMMPARHTALHTLGSHSGWPGAAVQQLVAPCPREQQVVSRHAALGTASKTDTTHSICSTHTIYSQQVVSWHAAVLIAQLLHPLQAPLQVPCLVIRQPAGRRGAWDQPLAAEAAQAAAAGGSTQPGLEPLRLCLPWVQQPSQERMRVC